MADCQNIGIVGLGVMGRNLAINLAEKGYTVAAFDPWEEARDSLSRQLEQEGDPALCRTHCHHGHAPGPDQRPRGSTLHPLHDQAGEPSID